MAEDDVVDDDYPMEGEEEEEQKGQARQKTQQRKPKEKIRCNPRLDELARPRKWALLALWKSFAETFDPERKEALRLRIQEEFSMTPEETEEYIASLRKPSDSKKRRYERMKELRKMKMQARKEAFYLFKKAMKKAMLYACTHVPPPVVSPLLRYMSESILVLLAEIHCVPVPKRCEKSNLGQFLIALGDWAAIFIAHIYYEVDLDENEEKNRQKLSDQEEENDEEEEEEEEEKLAADKKDAKDTDAEETENEEDNEVKPMGDTTENETEDENIYEGEDV